MKFLIKVLQGSLIGLGAVLPGVSGGVLCVIFGIYKPIMELLANPFGKLKSHVPKLAPVILGGIIGFLGVARILAILLERYPAPSVCVFVGLIAGMLPSLFQEAGEQGRSKASYVSMLVAMVVVLALLISLKVFSVNITPNFIWYVFCGFCAALSIIAPGMSFSTLLMPLGLYEPFVAGIGALDFSVLIPAGIGGIVTIILLAKAVDSLFDNHYSAAFHAIVGIVIAATVMIVPFGSFAESAESAVINVICLAAGVIASILLDKLNKKFPKE